MGATTGISWTDATWNPIRGCSRVSQGCVNCYAETMAAKPFMSGPHGPYAGLIDKNGRWNGTIAFVEHHLEDPIRWQQPKKIFVNSMSDLFHENLPFEQIDRIFAVMALADHHVFQVLTKRPARMLEYFDYNPTGSLADDTQARVTRAAAVIAAERGEDVDAPYWDTWLERWPIAHVWLGVSTENQETANERIPLLLRAPAAVHWISAEPLLGPIDLTRVRQQLAEHSYQISNVLHEKDVIDRGTWRPRLRWVVIGGESGAGHRAMDASWAASIAAQCRKANIPFWMKQDSGAKPGNQGRISDEDWIHEFPAVPTVAA